MVTASASSGTARTFAATNSSAAGRVGRAGYRTPQEPGNGLGTRGVIILLRPTAVYCQLHYRRRENASNKKATATIQLPSTRTPVCTQRVVGSSDT